MVWAAARNKTTRYGETERPSAYSRGYDVRWVRARVWFLRHNPFCKECQKSGIIKASAVLDHIEPHRGDMKKFWDKANWQSLCVECHNRKSQSEGMRIKKAIGIA